MIKLTDRSEAGWLVVEEYESDELAEDSEDDKKIRRAEDKAARKKKQLLQMSNKRQRMNASSFTMVRSEDRLLFRGNCVGSHTFFVNSIRLVCQDKPSL